MKNKSWIKIRIVIWSLIAILLSFGLINGIRVGGFGIFNESIDIKTMKVVKSLSFDDVKDLKNIKTNFNVSSLIISENDSDNNIKLIVKSNRKMKDNKYIKANIQSNTLNVEDYEKKREGLFPKLIKGYFLEVEMKVPKNYKGNFDINTKIGDVDIKSDLNINDLNIDVKTGDIDVDNKINAKRADVTTKVGDIKLSYLESKDVNVVTKTGDIKIDSFKGHGYIESKVGDIHCNIKDLTGDINTKSKVGDVNLSVSKNMSFIFEADKDLGEIDTDFEFNNISKYSGSFKGEYGKNPKNKIDVDIKTGNISLE